MYGLEIATWLKSELLHPEMDDRLMHYQEALKYEQQV